MFVDIAAILIDDLVQNSLPNLSHKLVPNKTDYAGMVVFWLQSLHLAKATMLTGKHF